MISGENAIDRDMKIQNKLLHISVITIYKHRVVGALLRDMSAPSIGSRRDYQPCTTGKPAQPRNRTKNSLSPWRQCLNDRWNFCIRLLNRTNTARMSDDYHIEVDLHQLNRHGQVVCGDVFHSKQIRAEGRSILVLSDGIGHGVKANVLATLTVSMALNYASFHTKPEGCCKYFHARLPKSIDGKESYATFTIIEIEDTGMVRIINYDNPRSILFRKGQMFNPKEIEIPIRGDENAGKILRIREFTPLLEDRIIFMTDGITQSGLGSSRFPNRMGNLTTLPGLQKIKLPGTTKFRHQTFPKNFKPGLHERFV